MDNEYEWGPWIDHDGNGCPCVGELVQVIRRNGDISNPYIAHSMVKGNPLPGSPLDDCWVHMPKPRDIVRYRIRKPRSKAMDILRALVNDPDTPINAPTGPLRELTPA